MNFRDRWEIDEETGKRFLFTVEMQRKLARAGLPIEPAFVGQLQSLSQESNSRAPIREEADAAFRAAPKGTRSKISGPETIQIDPQTGKYIGQVKWYNPQKGFGFILRGEGEEIFFHRSASVGEKLDLPDGQWVLYDVEDTQKGPEATDVELYEGSIPT